MRFRDLFFVFVMPSALSACMGMCNCSDAPPQWQTDVAFIIPPVIDEDAGAWVYPDIECEATMTHGSNVITYDVTSAGCTKTGGDALGDGSSRLTGCGAGDQNDAASGRGALIFALDAADEAYLGGLDFNFDLMCNQGTEVHSQEHFETQTCGY